MKQISKVLNRNFFKELSEDVELINDSVKSEEEIARQKAVSQFFNVVPDVLRKLEKPSTIVFCRLDEPGYEDCPAPDFGLPDYFTELCFSVLRLFSIFVLHGVRNLSPLHTFTPLPVGV